jgi:uncharacterized protein (TIGR03000 family)
MTYRSGSYYGSMESSYGALSMPGDDGYRDDNRNRGDRDESRAEAPATFVVSLPADARLTVNGATTKSTSATRTFVSPPLPAGSTFYYRLKAEMMRDGKPITSTRRIAVRAGEETHVTLDFRDTALTRR